MAIRGIIVSCIIAGVLACPSYSQNRVETLLSTLESKDIPDSTIVSSTLELSRQTISTRNEYLIGIYAPPAIEKAISVQDTTAWAELLIHLGNYWWHSGNYSSAANRFQQLRLLGSISNRNDWVIEGLKGLGNVYYMLENYDEALGIYHEGLSLARSDSNMLVRFYHNIANIYTVQEELDSVLFLYHKSVDYHRNHANFRDLSITYGNIALAYSLLNNKDSTNHYFSLAKDYAHRSGDPYQISSIFFHIGATIQGFNPNLAIESYSRSLQYAKEAHSSSLILDNLESLADVYSGLGQWKKAATFWEEAYAILDSTNTENTGLYLLLEEQEYLDRLSTIEKNRLDLLLELNKIKGKNQQKMIILILSIALFSLFVILLLGLKTYNLSRRIHHTRDRFFSLIAHDLRSPLNGVAGLTSVLVEETDPLKEPGLARKVIAIDQSIAKVKELTENLLDWAQTESGRIAYNPVHKSVRPVSENVVQLSFPLASQKRVKLINNISPDFLANFDERMVHSVLRNLISNALKFTSEGGSISLGAEAIGESLKISVVDTGTGIPPDRLKMMFSRDRRAPTSLTGSENSSGLGLVICTDFIRRHKGQFWAESQVGV